MFQSGTWAKATLTTAFTCSSSRSYESRGTPTLQTCEVHKPLQIGITLEVIATYSFLGQVELVSSQPGQCLMKMQTTGSLSESWFPHQMGQVLLSSSGLPPNSVFLYLLCAKHIKERDTWIISILFCSLL